MWLEAKSRPGRKGAGCDVAPPARMLMWTSLGAHVFPCHALCGTFSVLVGGGSLRPVIMPSACCVPLLPLLPLLRPVCSRRSEPLASGGS